MALHQKLLAIQKYILYGIVYYNYLLNIFIIWTALILLTYKGDAASLSFYLKNLGFIEHSETLVRGISRLEQFGGRSVEIFSGFIFFIATIEVIFLTAILRKRRWGIFGFMICSIIWLPLQIKLILSFFSVTKFSVFLINILIILFLINLAKKGKALSHNVKGKSGKL